MCDCGKDSTTQRRVEALIAEVGPSAAIYCVWDEDARSKNSIDLPTAMLTIMKHDDDRMLSYINEDGSFVLVALGAMSPYCICTCAEFQERLIVCRHVEELKRQFKDKESDLHKMYIVERRFPLLRGRGWE